jgi:hypothetical protein
MKNNFLLLVFAYFFLSACTKPELPDIQERPFGVYDAVSISTAIPIDISRSGRQTTEHINDFSYCSEFYSIEWQMNKETPSWILTISTS